MDPVYHEDNPSEDPMLASSLDPEKDAGADDTHEFFETQDPFPDVPFGPLVIGESEDDEPFGAHIEAAEYPSVPNIDEVPEVVSTEVDTADEPRGGGNGVKEVADSGSTTGGSRRWSTLSIALFILASLGVASYFIWDSFQDEDDVTDETAESQSEVGVDEVSTLCNSDYLVDLERVGVLSYGDKLSDNNINSLWQTGQTENSDAGAVLESAIKELFETVGDGCTPQGVALWRLHAANKVDAGRVGFDNFDTQQRIAIYKRESTTRVEVAREIAHQLNTCTDAQFVHWTVAEVPRIYVLAYTDVYDDVVSVHTPLPQIDVLPNGSRGLTVIRCTLGKSEGTNGAYVNVVYVIPGLRTLAFLESPAGIQIFRINPEVKDLDTDIQVQSAQEQVEQPQPTSGQKANQPTESEAQATPKTETVKIVNRSDSSNKVTPVSKPETDQTATESETAVAEPPSPPPKVDKPKAPSVKEEAGKTAEAEAEPEAQEAVEDAPATSTTKAVPPTKEACPDQGCPIEATLDDSGQKASDKGCGNTCGTTGEQGSGQDSSGTNPSTNLGDDGGDGCVSNCPGDNGGSGDDGDDGCVSNCPGDEGDGDGDKPSLDKSDPPDDDDDDLVATCPVGWFEDPFGNCKSPDPGTDGF